MGVKEGQETAKQAGSWGFSGQRSHGLLGAALGVGSRATPNACPVSSVCSRGDGTSVGGGARSGFPGLPACPRHTRSSAFRLAARAARPESVGPAFRRRRAAFRGGGGPPNRSPCAIRRAPSASKRSSPPCGVHGPPRKAERPPRSRCRNGFGARHAPFGAVSYAGSAGERQPTGWQRVTARKPPQVVAVPSNVQLCWGLTLEQ